MRLWVQSLAPQGEKKKKEEGRKEGEIEHFFIFYPLVVMTIRPRTISF
jgi:hypothetical protein